MVSSAAAELTAQLGVVLIEQALADRGEEMVVAEWVGDAALVNSGHRFGDTAAEVADGGQRVAEGGQGAFDCEPRFRLVFGSDLDRVQDPTGETVQAQEAAALAVVASGVEMQGIAMRHGGAQGPGALPVQGFEGQQEANAQRGHRTARQGDAAVGECGLDLAALEAAVIAGQAATHTMRSLPKRWPGGASSASRHGAWAASAAVTAEFVSHQGADGHRDQRAGLALVRAQGLAAVRAVGWFGGEIDARRDPVGPVAASRPSDALGALAGLFAAQPQQGVEPPFLTTSARSK